MNSAQAWTQVGLDIWSHLKYFLPPLFWMLFGALFCDEENKWPFTGLFGLFTISLLITIWSYQ